MKILVIGDAIIDHYVYGLVKRQSPEDPAVPVVDLVSEEYMLGGCLNVASNIKSLMRPKDEVYVSSIISRFTANLLKKKKILYDEVVLTASKDALHSRELIKTRIVESETHRQVVRLDNRLKFAEGDLQRYKNKCYFFNIKNFDAVVVSDYDKGVIDDYVMEKLWQYEGPIFVDTKKKDLSRWSNRPQTYVKVNSKEYDSCTGKDQVSYLVVTKGPDGADLFLGDKLDKSFPVKKVDKPSVIGAGDVFLAGFVVKFLESENDLYQAIEYGNKAASKSVKKFGTCEVTRNELA